MRTEHEIDCRHGPPDPASDAVATLVEVVRRAGCLPFRSHVEQVHEEVVRQRPGPVGEDAMRRLTKVGVERPHAANEHGHLGSGQRQHECPFEQQGLGR